MAHGQEVMDLSTSTMKRKNRDLDDGSVELGVSAKCRAKNSNNRTETDNLQDLMVVASGKVRRLKTYSPIQIEKGLLKHLGGRCQSIRPLPSGDLIITCGNGKQLASALACDDLGSDGKPIPVSIRKYSPRPCKSMAVISGVPLDMSNAEIADLTESSVSFVQRLKRKTEHGTSESSSVLLGFKEDKYPEYIKIG